MSGLPDPKPIRIKPPKNRFIKRKPKAKKKRVKLKSISYLKKKAWVLFSLFIRKRDSVNGLVRCVSCPAVVPWHESHASHFIDGRSGSVLFNPEIVYASCARCNLWLHGNKIPYTIFMQKKFGAERVEQMLIEAKQIKKLGRSDYEEVIRKYGDLENSL